MSLSEKVSTAFLDVINSLRPDVSTIYQESKDYNIGDWKVKQNGLVAASGTIAVAIPGLHLVGIAADVAFVLNRMSVATFGVGAILSTKAGFGNILEEEDFAAVLGYWSDDEDIMHAMKGKGSATAAKVGGKVAGKVFAKGLTKAMLTSSGYLIGQRLGGKALAKASAKFAGKFAGKAVGGFVPFVGPLISGGVNVWLISGIIGASENYYKDKIALISGR